jgi:hypothetical protein
MDPIASALALATALAEGAPFSAPPSGRVRYAVSAAIGDPQAPLERMLTILTAHGLLTDRGTLRDDVRLVSIGDHFDWGPVTDRARASYDGIRTLAWLSAHPADQVILLCGNHDLARVGELARFSDERFETARAEADLGYREHRPARAESLFCSEYDLPSWEVASRDLSAFKSAQREWVASLLRAGRLRIACSLGGVLLTHAGVSTFDLDRLALDERSRRAPEAVAAALEARLARALRRWRDEPLAIDDLHAPGNREGEGGGLLYQRFTSKPLDAWSARRDGLRRRSHVSELPAALVQAIGHIRDKKSLQLLGLDPAHATVGSLRTLTVFDGRWHYASRADLDRPSPDAATVIHLDGAMLDADPERYELYDLDRRAPLRKPS